MNRFTHQLVAMLLAAVVAAVPGVSRADRAARAVADFTVFLDLPTGFVFIKLPTGWKFVGKVDPADIAHLPAHAVTDLLGDDADRDVGQLALLPTCLHGGN